MTAYALTHLTIVWSDTIVIYKCQTTSVAHKIVHPISRPTGTTEASQWSRRPVNQARPTALFLSSQEQQCSSKTQALPQGHEASNEGTPGSQAGYRRAPAPRGSGREQEASN